MIGEVIDRLRSVIGGFEDRLRSGIRVFAAVPSVLRSVIRRVTMAGVPVSLVSPLEASRGVLCGALGPLSAGRADSGPMRFPGQVEAVPISRPASCHPGSWVSRAELSRNTCTSPARRVPGPPAYSVPMSGGDTAMPRRHRTHLRFACLPPGGLLSSGTTGAPLLPLAGVEGPVVAGHYLRGPLGRACPAPVVAVAGAGVGIASKAESVAARGGAGPTVVTARIGLGLEVHRLPIGLLLRLLWRRRLPVWPTSGGVRRMFRPG